MWEKKDNILCLTRNRIFTNFFKDFIIVFFLHTAWNLKGESKNLRVTCWKFI